MIKEFLNDKNYRLFELKALQNYLNKLTKLDMEILFQQENKETKTKKITIQVKKYTITFVLKRIVPKFETLLVKVYNEDNINIEQITFSYDEFYQIETNSNYYIDIKKLVKTNGMLRIMSKNNSYLNNVLTNEKYCSIKTSKKEIEEYFNQGFTIAKIFDYLTEESGRKPKYKKEKSRNLSLTKLKNKIPKKGRS